MATHSETRTEERLAAMLSAGEVSLTDPVRVVARKLGVSPALIHAISPEWGQLRSRTKRGMDDRALAAYLERRPEARFTAAIGGVTCLEIQQDLGWSNPRLMAALRRLNVERTRKLYLRRDGSGPTSARMKILGERQCVACGKFRPWRQIDQANFRKGTLKRVTCSRKCGRKASREGLPRSVDNWPSSLLAREPEAG